MANSKPQCTREKDRVGNSSFYFYSNLFILYYSCFQIHLKPLHCCRLSFEKTHAADVDPCFYDTPDSEINIQEQGYKINRIISCQIGMSV